MGVALSLAACTSDDDEPATETRLELASQSPAVRARLVRAVVDDADVARFLAGQLRANRSCATATADVAADTLTIASPTACDNGAGGTFQGQVTFLGVSGPFPAIRFAGVRFAGQTADDDLAIDGSLDFDFDDASQIFTAHVDLAMTRAGIAVHTSLSSENRPGLPILAGATLSLAGRTATIRGGLASDLTLAGVDTYAFTPAADGCGAGAVGDTQEEVCLRSPAPSTFTHGALRRFSATCAGTDGEVRFESTRGSPLIAWIDARSHQIGSGTFDPATSTYVFTASDPGCRGIAVRQYTVFQADGETGSSRSELLVVPPVTWGTAS